MIYFFFFASARGEREEARRAEEEEEMSGAGLGWTADYFCFVDTTLS